MLELSLDIEDFEYVDMNAFISLDYCNLFDPSDEIYEFACKSIEYIPDDVTAVACHCDEQVLGAYAYNKDGSFAGGYEYTISFIEELVRRTNWDGEDVMLMACSAGAGYNCPGEQLAEALSCTVWAPSDTLWFNPDGMFYINSEKILSNESVLLRKEKQELLWNEF